MSRRMMCMICATALVAAFSQPVWAQGPLMDISCESIPCGGGGGGRTYQYTLLNVTAQSLTLTDFCPGTDDLVVGNYSNWIAPAGFAAAATVAPWAALPQPPLSVMGTTTVQTPHGAIPPPNTVSTAGGVYWSGSVNVPPGGTVTFGFDNVNQTYEDVEWQVRTSGGYTVGLPTRPIAGPIGTYTHGWVHAPMAEEEIPQACCTQDGACLDGVLPSDCVNNYGGTPQGIGSVCLGQMACCLPDGTCVHVDILCCDDQGGTPSPVGAPNCLGDLDGNGVDEACDEEPQACCLDDGTGAGMNCIDGLLPGDCVLQGGTPQGPSSVCLGDIACCLPDGTCQDVDELCCDDLGGTPSTLSATCLGDADGDGVDDACETQQQTGYELEFSLDIGSDTELSDPQLDRDEGFDPGDVYWWGNYPVVNYNPPPWGTDGFKDDMRIFYWLTPGDPPPDPPDQDLDGIFGPDTAVPVGSSFFNYVDWFDLDGHDQIDIPLHDHQWFVWEEGLVLPPGQWIQPWNSPCIHGPEFLMISFDDDMAPGWPNSDVPVIVASAMMGISSYGMTTARDEVLGITLPPQPWGAGPPPIARYPLANEIAVHIDLRPNPDDGTDRYDDDVDSLDVVPEEVEPGVPVCPYWYFTPDHEATYKDQLGFPLDPGDIYEVVPGVGPVLVIDDVNNLGLKDNMATPIIEDADVDAFEFVFMEGLNIDPAPTSPVLAVLFSVDEDDPLTPGVDESGGLFPNALYVSFLDGNWYLVTDPTAPELDDDIDGLMAWESELIADPPWMVTAVSRKHHITGPPGGAGDAGNWDINLYPNYDVESRSAELQVAGSTSTTLLIEVKFDKSIVLLGLAGGDVLTDMGAITGVAQVGPDLLQVNMAGVPFTSKLHLWFPGVANAAAPTQLNTCSDQLCVGVLIGDYDQVLAGAYQRTNFLDFAKVKALYLNQFVTTVDMARGDFDTTGRPTFLDFSRVKAAGQINKGIIPCP